ncbi:hypothetical protein PR003_g16528 [Phytophthora rubi]|uniref:Myb/SANT-like domain-containing protein n=1 Tax=Phytophthora rubi TaxID=129364 RepID=A0A6A3KKA5_9STRA|nr:hypothetical protein PR002_g17222 [Phytophthora rubi]KAE9007262.1 hypothetical protein PR001_g17005 [Phytophthora rubi]KAE9325256.1 hypothetical protein PR003_g16528 [Phytophthora rubi]
MSATPPDPIYSKRRLAATSCLGSNRRDASAHGRCCAAFCPTKATEGEAYSKEEPKQGEQRAGVEPRDGGGLDAHAVCYILHSLCGSQNNARLREAWVLLAVDLSRRHDRPISTEQCKNKLKWLRRKWAEYNSDMTAIGNQSSPLIEPPRIELMQEYWSGSMGMNGNTLADNEGTGS